MSGATKELKGILPKSISDRYHLKKKLGEGGMGYVYLAEDTQLNRKVAIKTIRPELVENEDIKKRIDRECKMHAAVKLHPNIVGLYDRVSDENNIFLIMEYVEGRTLSEIIASAKQKKTALPPEITLAIINQSLDALGCIHSHNIIHRDIKPSNLIVSGIASGNPSTKLMDFGIARAILEDDSVTKLTMLDSGGPGTPAYMSPERIDSKTFGDICPATDLYAIGIILYEMFRLEPPFQGTLTEVLAGHLARVPAFDNMESVPDVIQSVLTKALKKNPADRYQDAKSFTIALQSTELPSDDKTLPATALDLAAIKALQNAGVKPSDQNISAKAKKSIIPWVIGLLVLGVAAWQGIPLLMKPNAPSSTNVTEGIPPSIDIDTVPIVIAPTPDEKIPLSNSEETSGEIEKVEQKIKPKTIVVEKIPAKATKDQIDKQLPTSPIPEEITLKAPVSNTQLSHGEDTASQIYSLQQAQNNLKQVTEPEMTEDVDADTVIAKEVMPQPKVITSSQEELINYVSQQVPEEITTPVRKKIFQERTKKSYNYISIPRR